MPVTVYYYPTSPPARAAIMTARVLGIDVQLKIVDLFKRENLTPEFLKLNPQHTVPVIDDDGFVLAESKAIAAYFVNQYAPGHKVYPKDPKTRAIIDQKLYFEATQVFPQMALIAQDIFFKGEKSISDERKKGVNDVLTFLEGFLENGAGTWVAGDHYTIADIAIFSCIISIKEVDWDLSTFPRIQKWLESCKTIPGYEENLAGAKQFGIGFKSFLARGKFQIE